MSTSLSSAIQPSVQQTTPSTDICPAIVFAIAGHLLALPLPAVLRVLASSATPPINNSDQRLVYVDQQPIPLVDLRPHLQPLHQPTAIAPKPQPFLLLAAVHPDSPIAIPIDEAPNLTTLSQATMRALPPTYRQQIGNIASHVAVIEPQKQQEKLTILLLDLYQLTPPSDTSAS